MSLSLSLATGSVIFTRTSRGLVTTAKRFTPRSKKMTVLLSYSVSFVSKIPRLMTIKVLSKNAAIFVP